MTTFDPFDQSSWFFGHLTRNQAVEILELEDERGVFLVRYSHSVTGDLVLSVNEVNKISHYIINKEISADGDSRYKIGENTFPNIPMLLSYYKNHYLDSTMLIRAAKKLEYVRAKFDFLGRDQEDLPFKKNEILTVIPKEGDSWRRAKNEKGDFGTIPMAYVELIDKDEYSVEKNLIGPTTNGQMPNNSGHNQDNQASSLSDSSSQQRTTINNVSSSQSLSTVPNNASESSNNLNKINDQPQTKKSVTNMNRKLPAKAEVILQRIPNAYDKKALKLEKGDIITVTNTNINGQWEGEINGKKGHFPFNYVRFLDDDQ